VGADADRAALVGFLQQLGGGQRTLGPQGFVVLLAEAARVLKGADDEHDGGELGLGVTDLILVQREGLGQVLGWDDEEKQSVRGGREN